MQGCSCLQHISQVVKQALFCCFGTCNSVASKLVAWWFQGVVMGVVEQKTHKSHYWLYILKLLENVGRDTRWWHGQFRTFTQLQPGDSGITSQPKSLFVLKVTEKKTWQYQQQAHPSNQQWNLKKKILGLFPSCLWQWSRQHPPTGRLGFYHLWSQV